jgi:hypothetical protein
MLMPRALVLVLTGAVDWHQPPAPSKEGLDRKHGIFGNRS